MATILIVEDEPRLARLLADYLAHAGYATRHTDSAEQAMEWGLAGDIDGILLDLMLPDGDGITVCKTLRRNSQVPILMLTARVDEIDRLLGLELGADDYICKPFSPREVVARVKAVLRRTRPDQTAMEPGLTLDQDRYEVVIDNRRTALTAIEFALLATLARHPGRIWSRDRLMDEIYQDHRVVSDRTIDSHIRKLRRKLADAHASDHDWIGSVYGVGYRLETP